MLFQMEWAYCYRDESGRLRDDVSLLNDNWPSFATDEEAEQYLEDTDVRATLVPKENAIRDPFHK